MNGKLDNTASGFLMASDATRMHCFFILKKMQIRLPGHSVYVYLPNVAGAMVTWLRRKFSYKLYDYQMRHSLIIDALN